MRSGKKKLNRSNQNFIRNLKLRLKCAITTKEKIRNAYITYLPQSLRVLITLQLNRSSGKILVQSLKLRVKCTITTKEKIRNALHNLLTYKTVVPYSLKPIQT